MNCSSCHNAHGAIGESLNTDERTNDLCLNCHTRYQGPFVFGHAPVEDDCTICHDPHGSVANNLLAQNEPFLCLQCHEGHFHMLRESDYSVSEADFLANDLDDKYPGETSIGTKNPYEDANNVFTSAATQATADIVNIHGDEGFQTSYGTKCTTCHKVVHGSDFPSQPLTGGGLTR